MSLWRKKKKKESQTADIEKKMIRNCIIGRTRKRSKSKISKSAKRGRPSGQGSHTQSQVRDNEGSDVEFLKQSTVCLIIF